MTYSLSNQKQSMTEIKHTNKTKNSIFKKTLKLFRKREIKYKGVKIFDNVNFLTCSKV